jgi:two-component system sensor histidine kinase MprB
VLVSAAAVAAAVVIASVVVFIVVRGQLRGQIDDTLKERLGEVSVRRDFGGRLEFRLPPPPLGGARAYAQLVTGDGSVQLLPDETVPLPQVDRAAQVAAGNEGGYLADAHVGKTHVRLLVAQVAPGVAVELARPLTEVDHTMRRLALLLVLVGIGGVLAAAGLGLVVARAALSPVRRLTGLAEHVAETRDLSRRIGLRGDDELARLAASFDTMLAALEESVTAQRRLVADASHELRTPLTSLRTNVEVLARADRLPVEEQKRILGDLTVQADELTSLLGALVELARGDAPAPEPEDVRLDELVEDVVGRWRRHAPAVRFEVDARPATVRGVPDRVERAVVNLLENAAKWSSAGDEVRVTVRPGEVTVRDHGPGIDPADLPLVFDRFYRAPAARGLPGSGLGLSIVRQVMESHGGTATAEAAPGGGALLRLRFPHEPNGAGPRMEG